MYRKPAPMSGLHLPDDFDCGKTELNTYLVDRALTNHQENYARTYVIADRDFHVHAYYSICTGMIERNIAPRQVGGHGAPGEIPVVLLARLAVDSASQGKGLGGALLRHAFQMALQASEKIGISAMLVHALDDDAVRFYRRYNFRSAKGLDRTMLRSLRDIAASKDASVADP